MRTRSLICVALLSVMIGTDAPAKAAEILSAPLTPTQTEASRDNAEGASSETDSNSDAVTNQPLEEIVLSNTIELDRPAKGPMIVVVEKERHITHVLQNHNGQLKEIFSAKNTTGKKTTPTPNGRMVVANKRWDPQWTPPVSIDPQQKKVDSWSKNHSNPLGVAWMGLNCGFVGLHGTNSPNMIGRNASHGCVRHKNEDIKKLFGMISVGTPVYIVEKYAGTKIAMSDVNYLNEIAERELPVVAHAGNVKATYATR